MTAMRTNYALAFLLPVLLFAATVAVAQSVDVPALRTTHPLDDQWKFLRSDELTDEAALAAPATDWLAVTLPHTWNAVDAASVDLPGSYDRGVGWYRLEFAGPSVGVRHWLEIGAASLVADVWLNGQKLGQHKGGFTAFRFDVTDELLAGVANVLLIKVDNSEPRDDDSLTAIAPLGGDFNVSGGLYRHVTLVSTPAAVHFDLGDSGGPGVYASTSIIQTDGTATVDVRSKLANDATAPTSATVRVALIDTAGATAATAEQSIELAPGQTGETVLVLQVPSAHLWRGKADPYLYRLVAELVAADGTALDRIDQGFGIRSMRFDPNEGFFLNGEPLRLHGVAIHQDYQGKAWAVTEPEVEASLALIQEIGANAVRLGHYPFSDYTLARLDELGIVAWAETAVGLGTAVTKCSPNDATSEFVANATQQLTELIRQQFNHAAIALWAVGNESSARQLQCDEPHDNVTPVIRSLHETAKALDPGRATVYAEFDENIGRPLPFATAGITDVLGTNRYYWWYDLAVEEFQPLLDAIHTRYPSQPLGLSEYGAGGALTHHTDDPTGGPPEVRSADEGEVTYQPEEYQAYVHEQVYRVISATPYLWGSFVWNMFDFGSAHRNEGDVLGVNTKGLVTFDRQTRKDAFYFYKANWNGEPTTYIVGRRYTDRAYGVADVKVYSNADSLELAVNGTPFATLTADRCEQKTCTFADVPLVLGANTVTVTGNHAGIAVTDSVQWSISSSSVNIAAGRLATGYVSTSGLRYGSDEFFNGGSAGSIDAGDVDGGTPPVAATDDDGLYKFFRRGTFDYQIPLPDGAYELTLGFIEPNARARTGDNVFGVTANGQPLLASFDTRGEAGASRSVVEKRFQIEVSGGTLSLAFAPVVGDALVSSIAINPQ